jgi:CBS domain-containing protein
VDGADPQDAADGSEPTMPTVEDAVPDLHVLTVREVMSPDPLTLREDMRVEVAAELLASHGYTGAPVLDQAGRLSGVLHALDVALIHLPPEAPATRPVLVRHLVRPPVTVDPASPIHVAAGRMRSHGTDRLIVVEHDIRVVGLITGQDLLRTVTLQGDLLRRTVNERIAALGVTTVNASVEPTGIVFLTGTVDSVAARDRLVRAVGAIGGVMEVDELIAIRPPPGVPPPPWP